MFFLFAGAIYSVTAADNLLEIQTGNGFVNITNQGNTNKITCWEPNYFKYNFSTKSDGNSNAVSNALFSCNTGLNNLVNNQNNLINENRELRANNTHLANKVDELQNDLDDKTDVITNLTGRQDTIKSDQNTCEKDLAVCNTEKNNMKDNSVLNVIQNIFICMVIVIVVVAYVVIKMKREDKPQ